MEEILADADRRRLGQRHRQRLRRIFVGVASAVVTAGIVGFALGRLAQRTPQELAEEQRAASLRDNQISGEVNRVLLELWKMEDTEGLRNVGRSR